MCLAIKKMLSDAREKFRSCDLFFAGDVEYEILERQVMDDNLQHIVNGENDLYVSTVAVGWSPTHTMR